MVIQTHFILSFKRTKEVFLNNFGMKKSQANGSSTGVYQLLNLHEKSFNLRATPAHIIGSYAQIKDKGSNKPIFA